MKREDDFATDAANVRLRDRTARSRRISIRLALRRGLSLAHWWHRLAIIFESGSSMQKYIALGIVLSSTLFAGGIVFAQGEASTAPGDNPSQGGHGITFPIAELGNCNSKDECRAYCDDPAHADACLSFGERKGLMKKEEVAQARSLAKERGPGGCRGLACKAYCDTPEHADECIAFAQEHKLISAKDVQIAQVIKSGGGPGGCDSMSSCWNYCSDPSHGEECSRFARENGLEPPRPNIHPDVPSREEIEDRIKRDEPHINEEKARQVLLQKGGPGGCKTMDECKNYCEQESNMEACMRFAQENDLMSGEDVARAKKFMQQPGPGGCRGRACRTYCEDSTHTDECTAFAVDHGFMSKEEAGRIKKFRDIRGPGGCKGEECRTYCEDPAHRDACVAFAVENGFMTQEEADRMKTLQEMTGPGGCKGEECRTYCEDPAHREACIAFAKEHGMVGRPSEGDRHFPDRPLPPEEDQESQAGEHVPQGFGRREQMPIVGPGGCTSRETCEAFCKNNPDQCRSFRGEPPHTQGGGIPQDRFQNRQNNEDRRFAPQGGGRPPQFEPPHPPADMTPEQRQRYEEYQRHLQERQQYEGQPGMPPQPYQGQPSPSDTRYQQYQQYQQQYQSAPSVPPTGGLESVPPPSAPPPPPPSAPADAPTSLLGSYNLVASVSSIFSQLMHGLYLQR